MTPASIKEQLLEIRQLELDARKMVEDAVATKAKTIEEAKRKARKHMENAEHELEQYEDYLLKRSREEAEGRCQEIRKKGRVEEARLVEAAQANRKHTITLLLRCLAGEKAGETAEENGSQKP